MDAAVVPQINVNVTYGGPQFGRVVTANEPVTRGDLLAAIPLDLAWNCATSGGNGTMQVCLFSCLVCAWMALQAQQMAFIHERGQQPVQPAPR